ncbi:MAG TPA: exodeoxyribonuclease VII large subunit, partial [Usitatibacter sp.]|nr:exodeoxyribonuclease VII large subunit [Usitatibacter sp.]
EMQRLSQRLRQALARTLELRARRLAALRTALGHLDPTQVLARGYSIVRDTKGHVVLRGTDVDAGDALDVTFSEGGAGVTVRETR